MAYPINPYVHEQNLYRYHAAEQHYMEQLESRGKLIHLDNVAVDVEQLVLRAFQCDSRWCLRTVEKDGVKKIKGCCCTDLEVDVTRGEVERVIELGRQAVEKLAFSARDPLGDIARRMADGKFTHVTDAGETAFSHLRSGRCSLGWMNSDGRHLCGINGLCAALGVDLMDYKPEPCFMFPLHYVEVLPGKFFLTSVCEETHQAIGADRYTSKMRCLRKPQAGAPPAVMALKWEIITCFGAAFYRALAAAAAPFLEDAGDAEHARALREEAAAPPKKTTRRREAGTS